MLDTDGKELRIGELYYVKFQDCCITGNFMSTLRTVVYESEDKEKQHPSFLFDNGVVLEGNAIKLTYKG